jgi:type IV pilus assembly protein PilC
MPEFILRVGTPDGEIVERQVSAASLRAAQEEMRRQGLHIFASRRGAFKIRDFVPRIGRAVSTEQFLLFNQELLALVRAGLPIIQSFDILLERQKNARFKEILVEIREKLTSGIALSDAFGAYGNLFPPIYSTSIRAGERSGDLEGVLKRFLRYQKMIVSLRKKVVGALIYPAILVLLSAAMVFVMMTAMIHLATALQENLILVIVGTILVSFLVNRWATTSGRLMWDRIKLRIPLVGGVLHRFAIMQFTQSLGTLLAGGTPMVPAIEIASQSVTNQLVSSRISSIVQNVREGEPLWRSLDNTKVVSDLAVEMIKVGESTGALTEMLANVSEFYDEEIESRLARLVAAIEPLILVFMGGVIGVLLYAFYLPLFKLSQAGM